MSTARLSSSVQDREFMSSSDPSFVLEACIQTLPRRVANARAEIGCHRPHPFQAGSTVAEDKSTVTKSTACLGAWSARVVPAAFIVITFVVGWILGRPLTGETDASALVSWLLFVVILASPC